MAEDKAQPLSIPSPASSWVPGQMLWEMPRQQRNNALLDSQPSFVAPPEVLQGVAAVGQVAGEGLAPTVSNGPLSGASTVIVIGQAELTLTGAPVSVGKVAIANRD